MVDVASFQGFPPETFTFLHDLSFNNNRAWFEEHRATYESAVLDPLRALVVEAGSALRDVAPALNADPRVNKSIFRINRDTRFSKDKSPYKTHFACILWEGSGPKMACPGFYLHIEANLVVIGGGMYMFDKPYLARYREAVADPKSGAELERALTDVLAGGLAVKGERYKRVPRGYDADHERAELLKHKGLYVSHDVEPPEVAHTADFLDWCVEHWRSYASLHRWLRDEVSEPVQASARR